MWSQRRLTFLGQKGRALILKATWVPLKSSRILQDLLRPGRLLFNNVKTELWKHTHFSSFETRNALHFVLAQLLLFCNIKPAKSLAMKDT